MNGFKKYILAIDQSTSATKVMLFDRETNPISTKKPLPIFRKAAFVC